MLPNLGRKIESFFLPGYFSQVLAEVLMRDRPPCHPVTNVIGYMKPQKMSLFKNVRYNTKGKLRLVFFPLDHGLIESIQKWFLLNLVIFVIEIVLLMITMCRIITWKILIMQIIWSVDGVSLQIIFFLGIFDYSEISILKLRFVLTCRELGFIRTKLDN